MPRHTAYSPSPPNATLGRAFENLKHSPIVRGPEAFGTTDTILALLPPRAAKKLEALRRERDELVTLGQDALQEQQELIDQRNRAHTRIAQITNPRGANVPVTEDHPSLIEARTTFARAGARLEELKRVQDERSKRSNAIGNLIRSIERYLKALPETVAIETFDIEAPTVHEPPATAIERLRAQLRELALDIKQIEFAPIHSSVVKAAVRKEVEALAERGRPDVARLIEGGSQLRFAMQKVPIEIHGFVATDGAPRIIVPTANASVPDAIALVAFAMKGQIIAALETEVDECADDDNSLTDQERAAKIGELKAKMLATERVEEAFVEMTGGDVTRRADADPRAVLSISGPEPKGEFS